MSVRIRNLKPCEIVTHRGSTLGEFSQERPPKTAKLVAAISWSGGRAHSRYDLPASPVRFLRTSSFLNGSVERDNKSREH